MREPVKQFQPATRTRSDRSGASLKSHSFVWVTDYPISSKPSSGCCICNHPVPIDIDDRRWSSSELGHLYGALVGEGTPRDLQWLSIRWTIDIRQRGHVGGGKWLFGGGVPLIGDLCAIQLCFERFGGGSYFRFG